MGFAMDTNYRRTLRAAAVAATVRASPQLLRRSFGLRPARAVPNAFRSVLIGISGPRSPQR
jgi:hypothetical protein